MISTNTAKLRPDLSTIALRWDGAGKLGEEGIGQSEMPAGSGQQTVVQSLKFQVQSLELRVKGFYRLLLTAYRLPFTN